jgi:hypothetical protein
MPLFRRPRYSLEESLKTTVIVHNLDEIRSEVIKDFDMWLGHPQASHANFKNFSLKVFIPYGLTADQSFDPRCGWYTHHVSADLLCEGEFIMVGFLSEPLDSN